MQRFTTSPRDNRRKIFDDGSANRRFHGRSFMFFALLHQVYGLLERAPVKPPITIFLIFVNIYAHLYPVYLEPLFYGDIGNVTYNCLKPSVIANTVYKCANYVMHWGKSSPTTTTDSILQSLYLAPVTNPCLEIPWNRIILSAFIHVDDIHLYYNMVSLTYKGISLESALGSGSFLFLTAYSVLMSHWLAVGISALMYQMYLLFPLYCKDLLAFSGYDTCAVGFSGVLFCYKYIWNQAYSSEASYIMGISVPTKYAAWVECILISYMTPNVSFVGHLAGIVAGVCYLHVFPRISKFFVMMTSKPASLKPTSPSYLRRSPSPVEEEGEGAGPGLGAFHRVDDRNNTLLRQRRLGRFDREFNG